MRRRIVAEAVNNALSFRKLGFVVLVGTVFNFLDISSVLICLPVDVDDHRNKEDKDKQKYDKACNKLRLQIVQVKDSVGIHGLSFI
jgi:hypothetical protein